MSDEKAATNEQVEMWKSLDSYSKREILALIVRIDEQQATIERLEANVKRRVGAYPRLTAQLKAAREALEKIANHAGAVDFLALCSDHPVRKIARAALEGEDK